MYKNNNLRSFYMPAVFLTDTIYVYSNQIQPCSSNSKAKINDKFLKNKIRVTTSYFIKTCCRTQLLFF